MSVRYRRFVSFWRAQGTTAVVRLIRAKLGDIVAGRPLLNPMTDAADEFDGGSRLTVRQAYMRRFLSLRPLPTYLIPRRPSLPRVSLVTDSIGSGSLFGGVGTALIFAAQFANRANATLRIVTRTEEAVPGNVAHVLNVYGIEMLHEVQFAFASVRNPKAGLDMQADEVFITTSWWTTAAALPGVPQHSILYLLQEDERMFYPFGEDRVHCEEVLRNRGIRFVINTRLLYDHLVATGLDHMSTSAQWFEPAFPKSVFHERSRPPGVKRRFFFYARPNNPRNLFYVGLTVIERAISAGVLDLDQWDIFLVGKDIPDVVFGDGYEPRRCEGLEWQEYAELAGTIDLGLSLMYTPHPSYPPLDLAASGAVVVTNRFGNKQDLSRYSRNIICADLDTASLVDALATGIALAEDEERRRSNFLGNALGTDWAESFDGVYQSLLAVG